VEVVISGIGVITPWGRGVEAFYDGLSQRQIALKACPALSSLTSSMAGLSTDVKFRQYLRRRKAAKLMTSAARLAMDAAGQILKEYTDDRSDLAAFLSVGREPPDEGEAENALVASVENGRFSEKRLSTMGRDLYPPLLPLKTLPNMILGHLSIHFGLQGENGVWAGEGVRAFTEGYWSIKEGRAATALVGAADSLVDLGQARDLIRMGMKNPPGEAAVMFLMESREGAVREGRKVWAEISHNHSKTKYNYLHEFIGDCGVAMPLLHLLSQFFEKSGDWNGFSYLIEDRL